MVSKHHARTSFGLKKKVEPDLTALSTTRDGNLGEDLGARLGIDNITKLATFLVLPPTGVLI